MYVVLGKYPEDENWRDVMSLEDDLLFFGGNATIFDTYEQVRNAVRRSLRRSKKMGYALWPKKNGYRIVRCHRAGITP